MSLFSSSSRYDLSTTISQDSSGNSSTLGTWLRFPTLSSFSDISWGRRYPRFDSRTVVYDPQSNSLHSSAEVPFLRYWRPKSRLIAFSVFWILPPVSTSSAFSKSSTLREQEYCFWDLVVAEWKWTMVSTLISTGRSQQTRKHRCTAYREREREHMPTFFKMPSRRSGLGAARSWYCTIAASHHRSWRYRLNGLSWTTMCW